MAAFSYFLREETAQPAGRKEPFLAIDVYFEDCLEMAGHVVVTLWKRLHSHCSGLPNAEHFESVELISKGSLEMSGHLVRTLVERFYMVAV